MPYVEQQAERWIIAADRIMTDRKIVYHAGDALELLDLMEAGKTPEEAVNSVFEETNVTGNS